MTTYLEIVIQERSTDGRHILTHRHFRIDTKHAGDLAEFYTRRTYAELTDTHQLFTLSDPLRPCSICYTFPKEQTHDPR